MERGLCKWENMHPHPEGQPIPSPSGAPTSVTFLTMGCGTPLAKRHPSISPFDLAEQTERVAYLTVEGTGVGSCWSRCRSPFEVTGRLWFWGRLGLGFDLKYGIDFGRRVVQQANLSGRFGWGV